MQGNTGKYNAQSHDGGNGGDVELFGGEAKGEGFEDNGGEFTSTEKTVLLLVGPSFFLLHMYQTIISSYSRPLSHIIYLHSAQATSSSGGALLLLGTVDLSLSRPDTARHSRLDQLQLVLPAQGRMEQAGP